MWECVVFIAWSWITSWKTLYILDMLQIILELEDLEVFVSRFTFKSIKSYVELDVLDVVISPRIIKSKIIWILN